MADKSRKSPSQRAPEARQPIGGDTSATGQTRKMATDYSDRDREDNVRRGSGPALSRSLQGHLGRQLRAVYTELIHEPMPDKFAKLLEELATSKPQKAEKPEQE